MNNMILLLQINRIQSPTILKCFSSFLILSARQQMFALETQVSWGNHESLTLSDKVPSYIFASLHSWLCCFTVSQILSLTINLQIHHEGLFRKSLQSAYVLASISSLDIINDKCPVGWVLHHHRVSWVSGEGHVVQRQQVHGGAATVNRPRNCSGLQTETLLT